MSRHYLISHGQLNGLKSMADRLATLDRLSGDEMSTMSKTLAGIHHTAKHMPFLDNEKTSTIPMSEMEQMRHYMNGARYILYSPLKRVFLVLAGEQAIYVQIFKETGEYVDIYCNSDFPNMTLHEVQNDMKKHAQDWETGEELLDQHGNPIPDYPLPVLDENA